MNYNEHKDNPKSFCALSDLAHIKFICLLPNFEAAQDDYLSEYDSDKQKEQCRGKKKRHTVKNGVVITMSYLFLFVSQTVSDKTHDNSHALGSTKFMRIVKDECQLRANCFVEGIFATCATLHNQRIKIKP